MRLSRTGRQARKASERIDVAGLYFLLRGLTTSVVRIWTGQSFNHPAMSH
jgi:hypothetical protein